MHIAACFLQIDEATCLLPIDVATCVLSIDVATCVLPIDENTCFLPIAVATYMCVTNTVDADCRYTELLPKDVL